MTEPSLTESFAEVACCDADTAIRYVQRSGGDLQRALATFFSDQHTVWDRAPPPTQPVPVPEPGKAAATAKAGEAAGHDDSEGHIEGKKAEGVVPTKKRPSAALDDHREEEEAEQADKVPDHLDPSLPWNKVRFDPSPAGAEPFAYDAIKSKVQTTKFGGPQEGSTWHWFLVADQTVFPDDDNTTGAPPALKADTTTCMNASTYINGDKFQAGWTRQPDEKVGEKVLQTRKASMVESILNQSVNSYGKNRGGCPPGYSHRWMYENSTWDEGAKGESKGRAAKTTECFWDEQKNVDRWLVNVHMKWATQDSCIAPGIYVIVADQVATKMNKNQYKTSMKGRRWHIGTIGDEKAVLDSRKRDVLAHCLAGLKASVPSPKLLKGPPAKKQKKSPEGNKKP